MQMLCYIKNMGTIIFFIFITPFSGYIKSFGNILDANKSNELFFIYNNPRYSYIFEELKLYLIFDIQGNWEHRIYIYSNVQKPKDLIRKILIIFILASNKYLN